MNVNPFFIVVTAISTCGKRMRQYWLNPITEGIFRPLARLAFKPDIGLFRRFSSDESYVLTSLVATYSDNSGSSMPQSYVQKTKAVCRIGYSRWSIVGITLPQLAQKY